MATFLDTMPPNPAPNFAIMRKPRSGIYNDSTRPSEASLMRFTSCQRTTSWVVGCLLVWFWFCRRQRSAAVISRHDLDVVINPRVKCWKLCVIFGSACKENLCFAWLESMIFIFSDFGLYHPLTGDLNRTWHVFGISSVCLGWIWPMKPTSRLNGGDFISAVFCFQSIPWQLSRLAVNVSQSCTFD